MNARARLVVCAVLFLVLTVFLAPSVFGDETEASSAISSAKQQIVTCFDAASKAEDVGANISSLNGRLNSAGLLLSDAELAFSNGDFDVARDLAVQSSGELDGFVSEATALAVAAYQQWTRDFLISVVAPVAGVIIVLIVSFAVWSFLKERYGETGEDSSESSGT